MGSVSAAHLVQFYSGAERLAQSLSSIFADSLLRGETVVVVAGNDHREALDTALVDAGVNLAAENRSGRYLQVDVDQALDGLMRPKGPDAELFNSTIGDTIDQARRRTGTVNAYGEMVGVLAQRGDLPSALQLEGLWEAVLQRNPLRLLCGYPRDVVGRTSPAFDSICAAHDAVLVSREPEEPALSASLDLPLRPDAVTTARLATGDMLAAWGVLDAAALADAGVVVSELVEAAVRARATRVSLGLAMDGDQVLVSVTDAELRTPSAAAEPELAAIGRSCALLTSLTQAWGVETLPAGRRLWARLGRPAS